MVLQKAARLHRWFCFSLAWWGIGGLARGMAETEIHVDYTLSRIDQGVAWVSPYWGYNTPKLVGDGDVFDTVALWGSEPATSRGALYKYQDGAWRQGSVWEGLNYQPGTLLLDHQQRLVLIYPRQNDTPVVLRSRARGDSENFDPIPVPPAIGKAGYLGAGIYGDRIVLGYIGDPATYSFNLAMLDLETGEWSGPHLIAPAQRQTEPWTTWVYPVVQPDAHGVHLAVSNNADLSSYYDRILYMYIPYDDMSAPRPELVARVEPWTGNLAFGEAMWRTPDGSIYITGQHQPEGGTNQLHVYRRDPRTQQWSGQPISTSQVAAIFHAARDPERLWLSSTYGSALRLYTSIDRGGSWTPVSLPDFAPHELVSTFFLHGITPASGSVMPDRPTAVFSAGSHPDYQLWFVQFDTRPIPTAVSDDRMAAPLPARVSLQHNVPNPFNQGTVIRFSLPFDAETRLSVHNLQGQKIATLWAGPRAAGHHVVPWDGRDGSGRSLSTGVYFCRLQVGAQTWTRKLLLLK